MTEEDPKKGNVSVRINILKTGLKFGKLFSVFPGFYRAPITALGSHLSFTFCIFVYFFHIET